MLPYIEFRFLVTTHIFFYFSLCLEASLKIYVYMMNSLKLLIMKIRVLQVFEIIAMFAKGIEYTLHMSELDIIVLVKVYTCPSWSKLTKKKKVT